ncbi:unnamed protein product [Rotaria sp. Silwood2]|nr:unnamed protein product [Rotaria sp. Silwood2]CAF4647058.1 unnamed protein product [Rotaria sp. Silwood2]
MDILQGRSIEKANETTTEEAELFTIRRNFRLLIQDSHDPIEPTPIIDYAQEEILPLADACAPLTSIVHDILTYVSTALQATSDDSVDGLTRDESASICLYTMEWTDGYRSLYSTLNETLRISDRESLRPWFKYLKLFLTALVKLPCAPRQTVWRGVRKNISDEFSKGAKVTWWSFSSTTISLDVLENDLYLGKTGERTIFSIEVINGKSIRTHSYYKNEEEILLLPGTYMEVQAKLNPAPELYIIHLKQQIPTELLLEPPFEGIENIFIYLF